MGRKALKTNYALLVLNMALFIFNAWELYQGVQFGWITGFAAGSTGIGAFWIWLLIWEMRSDLRIDKEYLKHLEKSRDDRNFQGVIEQYKNSQKYYMDALEELKTREKNEYVSQSNQ